MQLENVIVAGAGPVGLITAVQLVKQGIPVTVLEAERTVCQDFRAPAFHSTSLDIFEKLGFLNEVEKIGLKVPTMIFSDIALNETIELPFSILKERGLTNHPYDLTIGQQALTNIIYKHLKGYSNCEVLFEHRVESVSQNSDSATVVCQTPEGEKTLSASWLIGADGARSRVRKSLDIPFDGFTWEDRFLLIHTRVDLTQKLGTVNFMANGPDWRLVMKIPYGLGEDEWVTRCVSSVPPGMPDEEATDPERLESIMQDLWKRDDPYKIVNTAIYAVNQRVAQRWRNGRILLTGDAAHLNSPLGGMGLNSGIHDGTNLAEKLGMVILGESNQDILDLYEYQRRQTTIDYIQKNTIENKKSQEESDMKKRAARIRFLRSLESDEEELLKFMSRWMMYDSLDYGESLILP